MDETITVEIDKETRRKLHQALLNSTSQAGDIIPVPIDWLVGKLKKIANTGQSVEPDHWRFRCMAREVAQEIISKIEQR